MISEQTILEAARLLGEAAKPSRVILFGSYARGDATESSDLDFLIIEPVITNRLAEWVRLRQVLRPLRVPVDLLVFSEDEVNARKTWTSGPLYWAFREGRKLVDTIG